MRLRYFEYILYLYFFVFVLLELQSLAISIHVNCVYQSLMYSHQNDKWIRTLYMHLVLISFGRQVNGRRAIFALFLNFRLFLYN